MLFNLVSYGVLNSIRKKIYGKVKSYIYSPFWKLRQETLIKQKYDSQEKNLIVFVISNKDFITGGLMSICSIYEETRKMEEVHSSSVIMCTLYEDPVLIKLTKFNNKITIFRLNQLFNYFNSVERLLIHIPTVYCYNFIQRVQNLDSIQQEWLNSVKQVHFNILIQNKLYAPNRNLINIMSNFCHLLTCTTAHEKYSTQDYQEEINIPLHKLSVFVSPEQYYYRPYEEKKDILVVSSDKQEKKSKIIDKIHQNFPNLEIIIVRGITYETYKRLISQAKWSLTFGEGLDGYFVEMIFSGGIGFAAYNEDFFTKDYQQLPGIYQSYEDLENRIVEDIKNFDNSDIYQKIHQEQFNKLEQEYNYKLYQRNLKNFYQYYYQN